jgi:hypothetical protein
VQTAPPGLLQSRKGYRGNACHMPCEKSSGQPIDTGKYPFGGIVQERSWNMSWLQYGCEK